MLLKFLMPFILISYVEKRSMFLKLPKLPLFHTVLFLTKKIPITKITKITIVPWASWYSKCNQYYKNTGYFSFSPLLYRKGQCSYCYWNYQHSTLFYFFSKKNQSSHSYQNYHCSYRLDYFKKIYILNVTIVTEIPDAFHFNILCRE